MQVSFHPNDESLLLKKRAKQILLTLWLLEDPQHNVFYLNRTVSSRAPISWICLESYLKWVFLRRAHWLKQLCIFSHWTNGWQVPIFGSAFFAGFFLAKLSQADLKLWSIVAIEHQDQGHKSINGNIFHSKIIYRLSEASIVFWAAENGLSWALLCVFQSLQGRWYLI